MLKNKCLISFLNWMPKDAAVGVQHSIGTWIITALVYNSYVSHVSKTSQKVTINHLCWFIIQMFYGHEIKIALKIFITNICK